MGTAANVVGTSGSYINEVEPSGFYVNVKEPPGFAAKAVFSKYRVVNICRFLHTNSGPLCRS